MKRQLKPKRVGVLLGITWDPADYDAEDRAEYDKVVAENFSWLVVRPYPGSIIEPCDECGVRTAIGPRQQEARAKENLGAEVYCTLCTMRQKKAAGVLVTLDLGNPYDAGD